MESVVSLSGSSADIQVPSYPSCVIVGLGNPGSKYVGTRHNVGRDLLDDLAKSSQEEKDVTWSSKFVSKYCLLQCRSRPVLLVKPETFMNLSGNSVRAWMRYLTKTRPAPEHPLPTLIVVYDDVDLPVGTIKIAQRGGHGGL